MTTTLRISIKILLLFWLLVISGCQMTNPYLGKDVGDLIIALDNTDPHNRVLVAQALQALGPEAAEAVPALIDRLFDPERNVRVAAREALVAIGPEAVEPLFLAQKRLIDYGTSSDIGENISEGIFSLDTNAIPELTRIFYKYEVGSPERFGVVSVLDNMNSRKGKEAVDAGSVLVIAQGDPWTPTQVIASRALVRLGDNVVPDLVTGLTNPESSIRYHSAMVLSQIGPDAIEAGPSLVLALDDSVPDVREAAAHALEEIGFPFEYSPNDSQKIDDLIAALHDPNPNIRAATAEALGNLGSKAESALPALLFAKEHDPDPAVRDAADIAIQKIQNASN